MNSEAEKFIDSLEATGEQFGILYRSFLKNGIPKHLAGQLLKVYLYAIMTRGRKKYGE